MPLPSPTAIWTESPQSGGAISLARLTPVKTAAGYWLFVPASTAPAGTTLGTVVTPAPGTGFSTLQLGAPATWGVAARRVARIARGYVLLY
jgi:hypothetical protein